jgi:hypothetical protein
MPPKARLAKGTIVQLPILLGAVVLGTSPSGERSSRWRRSSGPRHSSAAMIPPISGWMRAVRLPDWSSSMTALAFGRSVTGVRPASDKRMGCSGVKIDAAGVVRA